MSFSRSVLNMISFIVLSPASQFLSAIIMNINKVDGMAEFSERVGGGGGWCIKHFVFWIN